MRRNETAIFIDGPNLYATAQALGLKVNFRLLLKYYEDSTDLLRASYYTAVRERSADHDSIRPMLDWAEYNGYTMVTKPTKEWADPAGGRPKIKGNMDIEIAVDAMEIAPHIKHAVFFTGDGDFKSLLIAMQRAGVRCTVVSSIETKPPMCADELRRAADKFIELSELNTTINQPEEPKKASRYA